MYSFEGFGQQQTTTTTQVVYRTPAYPSVYMPAGYPAYYAPGVTFARRSDVGIPGQPYATQIDPAEIEAAVYKDLPTETAAVQEATVTGTEPKKVVKLKSGLEVPTYILQRDIARKEAEAARAAAVANIPPPKFHKIGIYATKEPAKAALAAIILGYIAGQIVYSLQN